MAKKKKAPHKLLTALHDAHDRRERLERLLESPNLDEIEEVHLRHLVVQAMERCEQVWQQIEGLPEHLEREKLLAFGQERKAQALAMVQRHNELKNEDRSSDLCYIREALPFVKGLTAEAAGKEISDKLSRYLLEIKRARSIRREVSELRKGKKGKHAKLQTPRGRPLNEIRQRVTDCFKNSR
ncbi:MAG: hypothetical protein WD688_18155 [Candidatus Binatia bacterium]